MLTQLAGIFFYLFSFVMLVAACMVVAARNPVHSALYLILVFFNAAGLFLLLGAEFLAMILLVVYVGAVAVLFLFVIMMLDVSSSQIQKSSIRHASVAITAALILAVELALTVNGYSPGDLSGSFPMPNLALRHNTAALGDILYTHYAYFFEISGLLLLVAMVGAIVLTLENRVGTKRQNISRQIGRTPETSIEIRKVDTGKGI